jgi:hypothetical protein
LTEKTGNLDLPVLWGLQELMAPPELTVLLAQRSSWWVSKGRKDFRDLLVSRGLLARLDLRARLEMLVLPARQYTFLVNRVRKEILVDLEPQVNLALPVRKASSGTQGLRVLLSFYLVSRVK